LGSFLEGTEFEVLDTQTDGWHTFVKRRVLEKGNSSYLENVDIVTMHQKGDQLLETAVADTNATERFTRSCGKVCN